MDQENLVDPGSGADDRSAAAQGTGSRFQLNLKLLLFDLN